MKKVLIIVAILLILVVGFLAFSGSGRDAVSDFFNEDADFGSFFDVEPISDNDFVANPGNNTATTTPIPRGPYQAPILRQISFEPASGYGFYATTTPVRTANELEQDETTPSTTSTSTVIRFQERATGHIYDVFDFIEAPQKISNITVQKVYKTLFTNDVNTFFTQSPTFNNELVRTSVIKIIPPKPETATASSTEQRLEQNDISSTIGSFTYLPSTNRILYSTSEATGTGIFTSNLERGDEKRVGSLLFNEFTIDPINESQALVQTKASSNIRGYAYTFSITNGNINKIIGDIPGLLVKMGPDLKYYIYSESTLNRPIIRMHDTTNGTTRQIGLQTIPEKCVFLNPSEAYCFGAPSYIAAQYPDDWYKGKVFNDEDLYKIDLLNGAVESVYIFEDRQKFDVIHPKLSPAKDMLVFQNKYDLTLWALDLEALNNQF